MITRMSCLQTTARPCHCVLLLLFIVGLTDFYFASTAWAMGQINHHLRQSPQIRTYRRIRVPLRVRYRFPPLHLNPAI